MEPEFPKFTGPHIIFVSVPSTLFDAAIQLNLYPFILTVMVTYSMIFLASWDLCWSDFCTEGPS